MVKYQLKRKQKKTGYEPFRFNGKPLDINLLDFWQWSSSDLINNALRGLLAEYIVASAVSSVSQVRRQWESYYVLSPEGIRIEVKSAAYIQSWAQKRHSNIRFSIAKRKGWDSNTNILTDTKSRHSDIYKPLGRFLRLHGTQGDGNIGAADRRFDQQRGGIILCKDSFKGLNSFL